MSPISRWWASVRPKSGTLQKDAVAGLPGAIGSVPDGMASAVLVGVNPVYGLYASFAGPIGGRSDGEHPTDGDHHDDCRRARRWFCPELDRSRGSGGGSVPDGPDGRGLDDRRRNPEARSLHPIRLPLGDDRLSDRSGGQHHLRPDTSLHRRRGRRGELAGKGTQRPVPSVLDRHGVAADRSRRRGIDRDRWAHSAQGLRLDHRSRLARPSSCWESTASPEWKMSAISRRGCPSLHCPTSHS